MPGEPEKLGHPVYLYCPGLIFDEVAKSRSNLWLRGPVFLWVNLFRASKLSLANSDSLPPSAVYAIFTFV